MDENVKLTPMFEQYQRIKADYPDALLFYRMGDFYELFFEDAITASRELQITLTSRSKNPQQNVPMCGVPWHSSRTYIAQLIDRGYVVAICEQTEDPKQSKGLVRREVTQVITPGTVLDDANLESASHNYLGCALSGDHSFAFVWADVSTGFWTGAEFSRKEDLWQWVCKMGPRELLLSPGLSLPEQNFPEHVHLVHLRELLPLRRAEDLLLKAQNVRDTDSLGLSTLPLLTCACAELLHYLELNQKCVADQLEPFSPLHLGDRMLIDDVTERNLELFVRLNGHKGKGTLRHVLDQTVTPMGGRWFEDMLHHPLRMREPILAIQAAVQFFLEDECREEIRTILGSCPDLERIAKRIAINRTGPADFKSLAASLSILPEIKALLEKRAQPECPEAVRDVLAHWDCLEDISLYLEKALLPELPQVITEGGLFRQGYNQELDDLLDMVEHAEQKLEEMLSCEREKSGISKLKLGYNRIFGYFYELSRAVKAEVPEHFIRRQSLANAERFTTPELKALEEKLLTASERRKSLEYELFLALREKIALESPRLLLMSRLLGQVDYWQALAHAGRRNAWVMPTFVDEGLLEIREGRHPVVEDIIGRTTFVPNELTLHPGRSLMLLTGPNMSGKSTVLRQTAILAIMAQMGSMVPAKAARLGLVDKVFSRVGASDNLARGASTFMVEMMETARILRQATQNSLIILDEIGRGTSTYDGVALAWSIVEYIVRRFNGRARTLFATHYHELTELEGRLPELFTMNIAIREYNGQIVFLHKLVPGPSDKSYGIDVARLAGVPRQVLTRARELLSHLESGKSRMQQTVRKTVQALLPGLDQKLPVEQTHRASSHPLEKALQALNPELLSPMDALNLLMDWKRRFGGKQR